MTKKDLLNKILVVHQKYSDDRKTTPESAMCLMWPTVDPPDVLANTPQLDEIEEFADYSFEEEDAIIFYDMNIKNAVDFIWERLFH